MPNDGFCGWQFWEMIEGGKAISFETDKVPFNPIIEVVSTHKYAIKQAALFEFNVGEGKLLVCSLKLKDSDPAAVWFKNELISYASGDSFNHECTITADELRALTEVKLIKTAANTNLAFNPNDKTAVRKNK